MEGQCTVSARHRKANALRRQLHEASRASHDFSAALLVNDPWGGLLPEEADALRVLSEQAGVIAAQLDTIGSAVFARLNAIEAAAVAARFAQTPEPK